MKLIDKVEIRKHKQPVAIRHIGTGRYLFTSSRKMYWYGQGPAKNAFHQEFAGWYVRDIEGYTVNSKGQEFDLESSYFDKQTKFEIVELQLPI